MRALLTWWYTISLPKTGPDTTPTERERTRYRRLTAAFTLLMLVILVAFMPFILLSPYSGNVTPIALIALGCAFCSLMFNKLGFNITAASMLVLGVSVDAMGTLVTRNLDPSNLPLMSILIIPLILAGSLMPPVAALIDALLNSVFLILLGRFQTPTAAYRGMITHGLYFLAILLPVAIQIIVALVIYAIMNNLLATIRRADRAEEIVELQKSIAEFERAQTADKENLEEGLTVIAQVHAEVARGNLNARVPLGSENALWQIAVPLNNLLNRIQQWKNNSDQGEWTQSAITYITQEMQNARKNRQPVSFPQHTGTTIDPLLSEINHLSRQAVSTSSAHSTPGRQE